MGSSIGKNRNGEGTVHQRKNGKYEAALSYRSPTGGVKRRRVERATREEADLALARMKVDRDGGVVFGGPNPTLREFVIPWLRDVVVPNVSPKTLETYEVACRLHILPTLGNVRLKDLTARKIQSLYAQKYAEGLSVATRQKIHGTLKRALRQAVEWGEIPASPAANLSPPKAPPEDDEGSEEIQAYSEDEARRLFQAAIERGDRFRNLYVVAVRAGLRQGELLALRWEDLDLDANPATLMLRRSLAPRIGGGFYMTPLKKKRQRRRVALHYEAAQALRDQRTLQDEERAAGPWDDSGLGHDLVFPSTRGTPMFGRNLYNRYYRPTLDAAGLPRLPFHALRHTFASIALFEWKFPVKMVSELLGHASVILTLNTYAHLIQGSHEQEMMRINAAYSPPRGVEKQA